MSADFSYRDVEAFAAQYYSAQGVKRTLKLIPYGYNLIFLAVAQNAQPIAQLQIAANADFVFTAFSHRAQIGAIQNLSTVTAPFLRMLITDSGSNEQFTNSAVDLLNYGGNTAAFRNLPYPRIISGRSSLAVQLFNYAPTAESYTTVDLFFEGVLVRSYQDQG